MDSLTVSSSLLSPSSDGKQLTPAMLAVLWVIADELDRKRIPAKTDDAIWLEIPSKRLRGENGRSDNVWLRECLERLTGIKLNGSYRDSDWVAVMVAEAHITQGGALARILIPPAAIYAIRAPETFAKLEYHAAFKLTGHARKLYALLADKKRLGQPHWTYDLDELRGLLDVQTKKSYLRFNNFRQWVLDSALEEINDFGTVTVKMTPQRVGRAVKSVRFDWDWKSIDAARVTDEENERHASARHKAELERDAPPLSNVRPTVTSPIVLELKRVIEPDQWESGFGKCNFIEDVSGGVKVIAPTKFLADHIKTNFQKEITDARQKCAIEGAVMVIPK